MSRRAELYRQERGFTIMELLIATGISAILLAGLMTQYHMGVRQSHDQAIRIGALLQAQATLQMIGSEIRMLGNGVPFDQTNFHIGESTIADVTLTYPIQISTATTDRITFRLNESGNVHLLTQDFNPGVADTIYLTDVDNIGPNDPIYLSNSVREEHDGLYGEVQAVSSATKSITLKAGFTYSPGATFKTGSICEVVPLITYTNSANGITRDSGFGAVTLGKGSTMTLQYLNSANAPIALPLTEIVMRNDLRAIRVTVTQSGTNKLSSGQNYSTSVSQVYTIRNLTYLY